MAYFGQPTLTSNSIILYGGQWGWGGPLNQLTWVCFQLCHKSSQELSFHLATPTAAPFWGEEWTVCMYILCYMCVVFKLCLI